MQSDRSDDRGGALTANRLPYALLAHPAMQMLRMATKLVLPWFLVAAAYGEAMYAGLLAFAACHLALLGLDEALIFAARVDLSLWRRMRRRHLLSGLGAATLLALVGAWIWWGLDELVLGPLVVGLAPMVWIATSAVLPTNLLVRQRRYRDVFVVDALSVASLSVTTILLAWLGAGTWSVIGGLYANAIVAALVSTTLAAPHLPREEGDDSTWQELRGYRWQLTGGSLVGFLGDRVDSFLLLPGLGAAAFGFYDFAQNLATPIYNYATNLSERLLFPTLSARHHRQAAATAWAETLRVVVTFLLPLHVVLAMAADPLVATFFPDAWQPAIPLLVLLALAGGFRCCDVAATTALKAAGRSGVALALSLARIASLAAVLFVCMPHGLLPAAAGVLGLRAAIALLASGLARSLLPLPEGVPAVPLGLLPFGLWTAVFVGAAWPLGRADLAPALHLVALGLMATLLWVIVRWLSDRPALFREWSWVHARIASRDPS